MAPAALTQADIKDYLATADDFQLELEVLHACREAEYEVQHGGTYEDPTTNKPRQFDLRISILTDRKELKLAVECKSLKRSRPLLISRIPRAENERQHDIVASYHNENQVAASKTFRVRPSASMYPRHDMVGKSMKQPFKTPQGTWQDADTEVYDKWAQALASSRDLIIEAGITALKLKRRMMWTLILPVLVIRDDTLWVIDYDVNGKVTEPPRLIEQAEVYVGKEYHVDLPTLAFPAQYMLSHLHVFTLSRFKKWIDRLNPLFDWQDLLPSRFSEIDGEVLSG